MIWSRTCEDIGAVQLDAGQGTAAGSKPLSRLGLTGDIAPQVPPTDQSGPLRQGKLPQGGQFKH